MIVGRTPDSSSGFDNTVVLSNEQADQRPLLATRSHCESFTLSIKRTIVHFVRNPGWEVTDWYTGQSSSRWLRKPRARGETWAAVLRRPDYPLTDRSKFC